MADIRFLMKPDSDVDINLAIIALENLGLTDYDIQKILSKIKRKNEYSGKLGDIINEYRIHCNQQRSSGLSNSIDSEDQIDLLKELKIALMEKCKLRMENDRLRDANDLNSKVACELEQELLNTNINQMKLDSELKILKNQLDKKYEESRTVESIETEYQSIITNMSEELAKQKNIITDMKNNQFFLPSSGNTTEDNKVSKGPNSMPEPPIFISDDGIQENLCEFDLQDLNHISLQIQEKKWQDSKSVSVLWFLLKMHMMLLAKMKRYKIIDDDSCTHPEKEDLKRLFDEAQTLFVDSVNQLKRLTNLKEDFPIRSNVKHVELM